MANLDVLLFLHFQARVGDVSITGFKSAKARALLAYLAMETGRPHARASLAALLWPDLSEQTALGNLRSVLSNLRTVLEKNTGQASPLLLADNQTIQLNPEWVTCDVTTFQTLVQAGKLKEAVALYRGRLLQEFYSGSAPFDDWQQLNAEALHQEAMHALTCLIQENRQAGNLELCLRYAQRQVTLDPADEEAHLNLAYLLERNRQYGAALNQIDFCRQILVKELGVKLSPDMLDLEMAIQNHREPAVPRTLNPGGRPVLQAITRPNGLLVSREREMGVLHTHLADALNGHTKMIFVTGDSGCGKSTLVEAFIAQATGEHPEIIALGGECAFHGGPATPYLPFREMVLQFTRPGEGYGRYKRARAKSAQEPSLATPAILDLLNEAAPDLALLFKSSLEPNSRPAVPPKPPADSENELARAVQQGALYQQSASLVEQLSRRYPLLIVIDDLQWADTESLNLLLFLGQRLAGSRVLFIGIYRSHEVSAGLEGQVHPLESCVNELVRLYGDIILNLNETDGKAFVEAFLNSFPNRFRPEFRKTLFQHTGGHALFTVDLVESLQKTGFIRQDARGDWVESQAIDWNKIPTRMEAIITQRFKRLPTFWQNALSVASVEGEIFTGEVLVQVLESKPPAIIQGLSRIAGRQHGLVELEEIRMEHGRRITLFRFRHSVYQQFLYQRMDAAERTLLHEAVGGALEQIYRERNSLALMASQLAYHFEQAGCLDKAAAYAYQAGHAAVLISAMNEAKNHLLRAYDLLKLVEPGEANNRLRLNVLVDLSLVTVALDGWGSEERFQILGEARQLAGDMGTRSEQLLIFSQLVGNYLGSGQFQTAIGKGSELLSLAEQAGETGFVALAHMIQGEALLLLGRLTEGMAILEESLAYIDAHRSDPLFSNYNADEQITRVFYAQGLLFTGFPQRARAELERSLAVARRSQAPLILGMALTGGSIVQAVFTEDISGVLETIDELREYTTRKEYQVFQPWVEFFDGWQAFQNGQWQTGVQALAVWQDTWKSRSGLIGHPFLLRTLADVMRVVGRAADGERLIGQLIQQVQTGQRLNNMEADMVRLRGECQLAQGDETSAEASFREAIDIAEGHGTRLFQLNAASSLCRLKIRQGAPDEAARRLLRLYQTFTEGFETPLLRTARLLLEAAGVQVENSGNPLP